MRKIAFLLSLGAVCVSILSGCKNKKYVVPKTSFDKVSVALSGVESSFSKYKPSEKTNSSSKNRAAKRIGQSDTSGALTEITSLYNSYDSQGDKIDDLGYNQPPMIQFQCLKKVFESAGKSFTFGTKYFDNISGTIYFDPTTGEQKDASDEYKYTYNFTLSLDLNIDSNDLINANVAFKILLSKGTEKIETNWFVTMILDYDMEKADPTYTLSMYTDNEEGQLPYLEYGYTYQYDFVDMKDGIVKEWRKFCYETNKAMVKDEAHDEFEDYWNESDFKAQIGASKWYKNADLRQIAHPDRAKTKKFASALFDKFGLNKTDINAKAFLDKSGARNTTISTIYQEFSTSLGKDVIYELVTETERRVLVRNRICVMDYDVHSEITQITLNEDTTLSYLFSGANEDCYCIWYYDKNGDALERAEEIDKLYFTLSVHYGANDEVKNFGNEYLNVKFSEIFESLGKVKYNSRASSALLTISDGKFITVVYVFIGEKVNSIVSLYFRGLFPEELTTLGFPEYEGENCLYDYELETQDELIISQTTQAELNKFDTDLVDANWSKEIGTDQVRYTKLVGNKLYTMVVNSAVISNGKVSITYSVIDVVKNEWPRSEIYNSSKFIFNLDTPVSKNGYFVHDSEGKKVTLKNFTESERNAFITTLKACGDEARTVSSDNGINAINVRVGNLIYNFTLLVDSNQIVFGYEASDSATYHVCTLTLEKVGTTETVQIPLNEDFTGYSLKQDISVGTYKLKRVDLALSSESYIPFVGLESYVGKISYNDNENKEILVSLNTKIAFYASISNTLEMQLLEL